MVRIRWCTLQLKRTQNMLSDGEDKREPKLECFLGERWNECDGKGKENRENGRIIQRKWYCSNFKPPLGVTNAIGCIGSCEAFRNRLGNTVKLWFDKSSNNPKSRLFAEHYPVSTLSSFRAFDCIMSQIYLVLYWSQVSLQVWAEYELCSVTPKTSTECVR